MAIRPPFPAHEPPIDPQSKLFRLPFLTWFRGVRDDLDATPSEVDRVELSAQGAAIGTTAIPTGVLAAGLYRVSWSARITTAAGVSSSLTVTIHWTDGGIACTFSGAAITGNTTSTTQSETQLIRIDAASPVSYSTAYASNAAGVMRYRLDVFLEALAE